jgi:hypothetical protein
VHEVFINENLNLVCGSLYFTLRKGKTCISRGVEGKEKEVERRFPWIKIDRVFAPATARYCINPVLCGCIFCKIILVFSPNIPFIPKIILTLLEVQIILD